MEHGKVESQAEFDGVARWECNVVCLVVCLKGFLLDFFKFCVLGIFGNVAVVVPDHLNEESLWFAFAVLVKHLLLDNVDDLFAIFLELGLDRCLVLRESLPKFGVFRVLLDGGNGSARSTF